MSQLDIRDIHTYYGDSYTLQGVTLTLEPGKVTGLLGRNGVGKSTLVHSIVGFTPPRRGSILLDGKELVNKSVHGIVRAGVGLVPQERRIFPSLTVEENLKINERKAAAGTKNPWTIKRVYELFPVLEKRGQNKGNLLSGGEQQMLALARALMGNPRYLLMDEPSEGLAPLIVRELGRIVDLLKEEGMGILLIEQHIHFVISHSDVVYIMNKGSLVHESAPAELEKNREIQKKYLGI